MTAKGEADKAGAERPPAATPTWPSTLHLQTARGTQASALWARDSGSLGNSRPPPKTTPAPWKAGRTPWAPRSPLLSPEPRDPPHVSGTLPATEGGSGGFKQKPFTSEQGHTAGRARNCLSDGGEARGAERGERRWATGRQASPAGEQPQPRRAALRLCARCSGGHALVGHSQGGRGEEVS